MIGKNSIIGSGITSNYSFVTKTEYSNPVESRGVQVRWVGQSWRVHCNSRKLSLMHSYFFDKNGNNVKEQESSGSILPSTPSQFQLGDKLVDYVCSHLNEAEERNSGASQGDVTPVNPAPTEKQSISLGTAWLSDTGYFITAFHVIENAKSISLAVGRNQVLDASLINADKINDIAILFADLRNTNMRGLAITKGYPKLGSRIFTLGFPHPDLMGVSPKFTAGEISSVNGMADDPRLLQISAPVQSGNSGGPLINMNGEVVGIISSKLRAATVLKETGDLTQNVNYAVKADYLRPLLYDLPLHPTHVLEIKPGKLEEMVSKILPSVVLVIAK